MGRMLQQQLRNNTHHKKRGNKPFKSILKNKHHERIKKQSTVDRTLRNEPRSKDF